MKKPCRPADICAHLGDDYDRYLGAIVTPLFQNTLFTRKHEEHGYSYSRINNPTIEILEKKLAALEHAPAARVFASGMAAAAASASSAPIARNMVPRASASAQVGAATVTDSRRETALHPVRGSIVWAILFPSASR